MYICIYECVCVFCDSIYNILKCSCAILPLDGSEVRHNISIFLFLKFVFNAYRVEVDALHTQQMCCILCVCCEQPLPTTLGSKVTVRSVLLAWFTMLFLFLPQNSHSREAALLHDTKPGLSLITQTALSPSILESH